MLIRNAIVSSSHERQIDIYRRGGGCILIMIMIDWQRSRVDQFFSQIFRVYNSPDVFRLRERKLLLVLLLGNLNSVQFSAFFKFYVFFFWFQQGTCWRKKVLDGNHYVRLQISYWYLWGDKIWFGGLQSFLRQQSGSWGDRKWWVPWREGCKGRHQCSRCYKD